MLHLAQVNVARPKAPVDTPLLAEFMAGLDPVMFREPFLPLDSAPSGRGAAW